MKLKEYAESKGIDYRTALRRFKAGLIPGEQLKGGSTITIFESGLEPAKGISEKLDEINGKLDLLIGRK